MVNKRQEEVISKGMSNEEFAIFVRHYNEQELLDARKLLDVVSMFILEIHQQWKEQQEARLPVTWGNLIGLCVGMLFGFWWGLI